MSEMVERVARAICCSGGCWRVRDPRYISQLPCAAPTYLQEARAAIEAMREPTVAMEQAGADASEGSTGLAWGIWGVMIDAALAP